MPMIEICTPWSESNVTTSFEMEGEHDVGNGGVRPLTVAGYIVKCRARPVGGQYAGDTLGTLYDDNTWTCQMSLTAGTYDLQSRLYRVSQGGVETLVDDDLVISVVVSAEPIITLDMVRNVTSANPINRAPQRVTGVYHPGQGDDVVVQVVNFKRKFHPNLAQTASYPTRKYPNSDPPHFETRPVELWRPTGVKHMHVVVAILLYRGVPIARHTTALRRA